MSEKEKMTIRVGTPDDVDDIMDLALSACDENGFVNPSPQKLLQEIYSALCQHNGLIGIIGDPYGPAEGAILLRMGELWYSGEKILEEKAIFIRPEYRSAKGGRARQLCEFSKHVADSLGIPLIIGVLSNARTEGKVRLYERQFGKPSGAYFLYGATTGNYKH